MENKKMIVVTSLHNGEGKSLISLGLAYALSIVNKKVLLIDGNFDEPSITKISDSTYFLEDYLKNRISVADIIQNGKVSIMGNRGGHTSLFEFCDESIVIPKFKYLRDVFDVIIVEIPSLDRLNKSREWIVATDKILGIFSSGDTIKPGYKPHIQFLNKLENSIYFIWKLFQCYIGFNLIMPIFLLAIYFIKSTQKQTFCNPNFEEADYAIIVTAYEQTNLLEGVVNSLLQLNYSNYLIYIVADKCDISNLFFDDERVILLRPKETLASNTRSHFYAINHFKRPHERLTIIDSDNLVHPEYINELNKFFDKGFNAVQGLRAAKSLNILYAALDAARDIYYHFYDGKVLFSVGSSATLAGSGMAFTVQLYKDCLAHLDITGAGFDKILQKQIVDKGYRIAFAEHAIVYDEKTAHSDQLINQRARWINTWFKYFSFGFSLFAKGVVNFSWNQLLFGLVLLRPPLFIF
jgi:hypothetical protein